MLSYLDLTLYSCPLPLLATKKAMSTLNKGCRLKISLNKQSSLADFELLALENDWHIEILEQAGENWVFFTK